MTENATPDRESLADDEGRPLEVYEWGGGLVAMLGFFFTPAITGIPATYCALKIREEKPLAAVGIGVALTVTVLFWSGFLFGEQLMIAVVQEATLLTMAAVVVLLFVAVFGTIYYLFTILGQNDSANDD